jgi:hypothetical protein
VSKYHNQSYFLNGLLKESYTIKGEDDNQKFSKTINKYEIRKLDSINNNFMTNTILPDNFDVGGAEGRRSAAVVLKSTTNELYELAPTPLITSKVEMTYDEKGRVVEYVNKGNLATTSDDYKSVINYHNLTALNILNVPASIKVFPTANSSGPAIRERRTEINPSNGTSRVWIESYDHTGKVIRVHPKAINGIQVESTHYPLTGKELAELLK